MQAQNRLDEVPGFRSVAAGVHGQSAADGSRYPSEELGTAQTVTRTESRHLGARDSRFRINQLSIRLIAIETDLVQRAMREDHGASQACIPNQEIAAQSDDVKRLGGRNRPNE